MCTALTEDQSWGPSTHVSQLSTTYDIKSRGFDALLQPLWALHSMYICPHRDAYNTSFKTIIFKFSVFSPETRWQSGFHVLADCRSPNPSSSVTTADSTV